MGKGEREKGEREKGNGEGEGGKGLKGGSGKVKRKREGLKGKG